jgi:hypothetical protein
MVINKKMSLRMMEKSLQKKKKSSLFLIMLFTKDNGKEKKDMAMEFKSGLTEPNTKDTGKMTRLMEKVNFITSKEIFMKEIGLRTK